MEGENEMELVEMKNIRGIIAAGALLLAGVSGCTVYDREGEWSEWKEDTYDKEVSYDVIEARLAENGALGYSSVESISAANLSRGLNPKIVADVEFLCDVETTRYYERSKEREIKTHYPIFGEDPDDIFEMLGNVIGYPFSWSGWQYNEYDTTYERERREESETVQQWVEPSTLDRDLRPEIEIPELELTRSTTYDDEVIFYLSDHTDRLLELDAITVRVVGRDASQSIPLADFHAAERARRDAVERAEIAEAERVAAEKAAAIAAAEAAERARQERLNAFAEKREDVRRLVDAKEYSAALAAQRELIGRVDAGDTDYGVARSSLVSEGLRIAGELGDLDAVSEFMAME